VQALLPRAVRHLPAEAVFAYGRLSLVLQDVRQVSFQSFMREERSVRYAGTLCARKGLKCRQIRFFPPPKTQVLAQYNEDILKGTPGRPPVMQTGFRVLVQIYIRCLFGKVCCTVLFHSESIEFNIGVRRSARTHTAERSGLLRRMNSTTCEMPTRALRAQNADGAQ